MTLNIKLKRFAPMLAAAVLSVAVSACGGGKDKDNDYYVYDAWYDVYGNYCGGGDPYPGCNFYWDGEKIIDVEDPYFSSSNVLELDLWIYTDSWGYTDTYYGWAWESPTGIIYDEWGNALNETDVELGRDPISTVAGEIEETVAAVGEEFAAKWDLDSDVGVNIARVLQDQAMWGRDRARGDEAIADFTMALYGMDLNGVKAAAIDYISNGADSPTARSAIEDTAELWRTDSGNVEDILTSWYGKYKPQ